MEIYEQRTKIYLVKDVKQQDMLNVLADYIDSYLMQDSQFADFHRERKIKNYVFDALYPTISGKEVYKGDVIYQFRIRTPDEKLAAYFAGGLAEHHTGFIKGLTRTVGTIPHRPIAQVYSLTPVILKDSQGKGYWRDSMSFPEFERTLKNNLLHKYGDFIGRRVEDEFSLYDQIELLSKCAIGVPYKGITLLGDKVSIRVSDNTEAQKVFYYALGGGLGTMGPRGMGFLNYKFV